MRQGHRRCDRRRRAWRPARKLDGNRRAEVASGPGNDDARAVESHWSSPWIAAIRAQCISHFRIRREHGGCMASPLSPITPLQISVTPCCHFNHAQPCYGAAALTRPESKSLSTTTSGNDSISQAAAAGSEPRPLIPALAPLYSIIRDLSYPLIRLTVGAITLHSWLGQADGGERNRHFCRQFARQARPRAGAAARLSHLCQRDDRRRLPNSWSVHAVLGGLARDRACLHHFRCFLAAWLWRDPSEAAAGNIR